MGVLNRRFPALLLLAGMGLAPTAQAELLDRAFAVYDTVSHLSWLKDANYAQTSGYDTDGQMTWAAGNAWAAGLTVGGYTGWRLPTTLQPDATCSGSFTDPTYGVQSGAFSCTGSELGNLFYNGLGGVANQSITTTHNANYDLFTNIQSSVYWSCTEFAPDPGSAWLFVAGNGFQNFVGKDIIFYAWAVRSGDVAAVPEPGVIGLFGVGALAWAGAKARRRG